MGVSEPVRLLRQRASALQAEAQALFLEAEELATAEILALPLPEQLIYAATARCMCGAGLAYNRATAGVRGSWKCSATLLYDTAAPERQAETKAAAHTNPLPFAFYEVKSENQPSAGGATTRPPA